MRTLTLIAALSCIASSQCLADTSVQPQLSTYVTRSSTGQPQLSVVGQTNHQVSAHAKIVHVTLTPLLTTPRSPRTLLKLNDLQQMWTRKVRIDHGRFEIDLPLNRGRRQRESGSVVGLVTLKYQIPGRSIIQTTQLVALDFPTLVDTYQFDR